MKISATVLKHLENRRDYTHDDLVAAHHQAHTLICDLQDDACTVDRNTMLRLIELSRRFAFSTMNEKGEIFAFNLLRKAGGEDLGYMFLDTISDENGRYATCSAWDRFDSMIEIA